MRRSDPVRADGQREDIQRRQQCKFTFSGANIAAVNIVMEKVNSGLDPYIELYDPSGRKVAADDDSAGNYNSAISNYVLGSSGVYTIVAKSYGNQIGEFKLKLKF